MWIALYLHFAIFQNTSIRFFLNVSFYFPVLDVTCDDLRSYHSDLYTKKKLSKLKIDNFPCSH